MAVSGKAKTTDLDSVRGAYARGESLRCIGGRFGVSGATVCRWARRYGWKRAVEAAAGDREARLPGEEEQEGSDYALVRAMTLSLIGRAREMLRGGELSVADMRNISCVLRDARVLLGSLTPLEKAEREMGLKALKNRVEPPEQEPVEVVFVGSTAEAAR